MAKAIRKHHRVKNIADRLKGIKSAFVILVGSCEPCQKMGENDLSLVLIL